MGYYIKLDNDDKIELPSELGTEQRIKLCEDIINSYPLYFKQCLPGSNCTELASYKVEMRLEVMANYILGSIDKDDDNPVMSEYKQKLVNNLEKPFSEFENKYDFD